MTDTIDDTAQQTDTTEYRCSIPSHPVQVHHHHAVRGDLNNLTWTVDLDFRDESGYQTLVPGRYRKDDSLPIYGADDTRYRCSETNHSSLGDEPHRHYRMSGDDWLTYSTNLDHVSINAERLPGVYVRDDALPVYDPALAPPQPVEAITIPTGDYRPRLAVSKDARGDIFLVMRVPSDSQVLQIRPDAHGWDLNRRGLGNDEQQRWLRHIVSTYPDRVSGYWIDRNGYRLIGDLHDADMERIFTDGGKEWAYAQIPVIIGQEIEDMRNRVTEALREQQKERDWCDELDTWMSRMGLDPRDSSERPRFRTFEVEVYFTATATISRSETVTLAVGDDDNGDLQSQARDVAEERIREDLKSSVDFGEYSYIEGSVSYEYDEDEILNEWDSDEDGDEV
jgi:hypothetical protein